MPYLCFMMMKNVDLSVYQFYEMIFFSPDINFNILFYTISLSNLLKYSPNFLSYFVFISVIFTSIAILTSHIPPSNSFYKYLIVSTITSSNNFTYSLSVSLLYQQNFYIFIVELAFLRNLITLEQDGPYFQKHFTIAIILADFQMGNFVYRMVYCGLGSVCRWCLLVDGEWRYLLMGDILCQILVGFLTNLELRLWIILAKLQPFSLGKYARRDVIVEISACFYFCDNLLSVNCCCCLVVAISKPFFKIDLHFLLFYNRVFLSLGSNECIFIKFDSNLIHIPISIFYNQLMEVYKSICFKVILYCQYYQIRNKIKIDIKQTCQVLLIILLFRPSQSKPHFINEISVMKTSIKSATMSNNNNKVQPQFGALTSFKQMEDYFQKCRFQSREHLLRRLQNYDCGVKRQQVMPKLQPVLSKEISNMNNTSTSFNTILSASIKKDTPNITTSRTINPSYFSNLHLPSTTNLQHTISTTFHQLVQWSDYDPSNPIVKEISRLFSLNLNYLIGKSPQQKRTYILERIHEEVEKNYCENDLCSGFETTSVGVEGGRDSSCCTEGNNSSQLTNNQKAFQWLGVQSPYTALKPIFQQILIQRVKLFDNQLSQLTSTSQNNFTSVSQLITTARTIDDTLYNKNNTRFQKLYHNQRNYNSLTNLSKRQQLKTKLNHPTSGFCNVKIRDQSTFSLDKWTKKQQKQFQTKRAQYKSRQSKIQNNPILFQFVKKYTKTVKARQNIYQKWENRQRTEITPEELKYLCATSLFLNQTLSKSEKDRYRRNIETAGKKLISKLEFNIAEHIIETYKTFMKKVFDLRADYYEDLTAKRKSEYTLAKKKEKLNEKALQKVAALKKGIKMFRTIVNSEKMQLLMNFKILRWVVLFCEKLKAKAKIKDKQLEKSKSVAFVKKLNSKRIHPFMMALKKAAPAAKILKRQNHDNIRPQTKKYVQTQRFYYQDTFQETINKFNRVKSLKTQQSTYSFRKQLSGGPRVQTNKIIVNLSKKTVHMQSKKCLFYIIKIQSIWRKLYYRKIFLKKLGEKRKRQQDDFERKYDRLWRIYPINKKINFEQIKSRLKRFSMRIINLAKPYVRTYRKPINIYTSFSRHSFSLQQLKIKYSKMSSRRLGEFVSLVQKNYYPIIVQNGYVITQKEINLAICSQGATVLWWAVSNSNFQLVKKLLEGGGDPNSKNNEDSSCLHEAMRKGDIEIIFILLDYGADLNVRNSKKHTPLYYCSQRMLKLLGLEDGVSVSDDKSGQQHKQLHQIDNNRLFYRPQKQQIYPQHYY